MKKVLEFLIDLSENNNREWYNSNKNRYNESREKILFLTDVLINEIRKFDADVPALTPKDCVFRIFRDVRFSNDKRPYKTNFGGFISKGGRKSSHAGYYFHIEPGGSFAGGGIYMPPAGPLKAIRDYLAEHGNEFRELITATEFKKTYPKMIDDKLKTAPKGFPKDHLNIDLLRYKSFAFADKFEENKISSDGFIDNIVQSFRTLYPVNKFLNEALKK